MLWFLLAKWPLVKALTFTLIIWLRRCQPSFSVVKWLVFFLSILHGQRSLAGYSPWGRKESNRTEHARTHTQTHTHSREQSWAPPPRGKGTVATCKMRPLPLICVFIQVFIHICVDSRIFLPFFVIQYVIFVVQTVPALAIGSSCRIILVSFWRTLLPFKGNFWKSKLYFAINFCFTKHYLIPAKAMSIYSSLCVCVHGSVCVCPCVCESVYVCAF